HRDLYRDPAWAEIYWSEAASVYVARAAHPELLSLAFSVIDPAAPELAAANAVRSRDPSRIAGARDELQRMLTASPTSTRATRALAVYCPRLGAPAERDRGMRALDPDDAAELMRRFTSSGTPRANCRGARRGRRRRRPRRARRRSRACARARRNSRGTARRRR